MSVAEECGGLVPTVHPSVVIIGSVESELASIRRAVGEFVAEHEADADVTADLELAVSELATNVLQHSSADSVTVVVSRAGNAWELDVSGADDLFSLGPVDPPSSSSRSGRGLMVVKAIMDEVKLMKADGRAFIRCRKFSG